jgi:Bacteriophage HK97-gp10, putative tail-component
MAAISIKFEGLDAALKKLSNKASVINSGINYELNAWALDTVTLAKKNCPVDEGFLRNSISANTSTLKDLRAEITVGANYGAYIEFGTRGYAAKYVSTLPADWKELAATFKGGGSKKGSFNEFLLEIVLWVKRKGIAGTYSVKTQKRTGGKKKDAQDLAVAFPIAMAIIRKGIKPQPYLYPAVNATRKKLIDRIKKVIES